MVNEKLKSFLEASKWKQDIAMTPLYPELENEIWIKKPFGTMQLVLSFTSITIHGNITEFISIDIKLEVNGIWYNLQAYSISPEEFMEKHVEIEDKLIALRSTLCP
jgi:hypothetical protein